MAADGDNESSNQENPASTASGCSKAPGSAFASLVDDIGAETAPAGAAALLSLFTSPSSPGAIPGSSPLLGKVSSPQRSSSDGMCAHDADLENSCDCAASTPVTKTSKYLQHRQFLDRPLATVFKTTLEKDTADRNYSSVFSFNSLSGRSEQNDREVYIGEKQPLLSTSKQNVSVISPSSLTLVSSVDTLHKAHIFNGSCPEDNLFDESPAAGNSVAWWDDLYNQQSRPSFDPAALEMTDKEPWTFASAVRRRKRPRSLCIPEARITEMCKFFSPKNIQMVFVGSTVYTLYNLVFCLAMASSINVPHRAHTMFGPIAKLCTMGVIAGVPVLLIGLSAEHPALYSVFDLFLAPFLAEMASVVDSTMYEQSQRTGIGLASTALGNFVALQVKLANIGEYLPYAVLCGFFSAVGVTLWTLAISVDTGLSIQAIVFSENWDVVKTSVIHHLPGALTGIIMYVFGPRNPLFVPILALTVVALSHVVMFVCNVSLEQAQRNKWFWTAEELIYTVKAENSADREGVYWGPTSPFGIVYAVFFTSSINFEAVANATPIVIAMALMYILRCYLHASAFRKSAKNVWEFLNQKSNTTSSVPSGRALHKPTIIGASSSVCSDFGVNEEIALFHLDRNTLSTVDQTKKSVIPQVLKALHWYSLGLLLLSLVGTGGGVLPGIAVGPCILKIGVEGLAPQYASILLMSYFYATDMSIVSFMPKMTFSSLLVLCSIEMINTWLIHSFSKIRQKEEWLAVPLLIVLYFMFGMLKAVALGVALSTFIFVASFYRTGVIKFMANGLTIQSTVERTNGDAMWLDQNGNLIQVLVLQNYLFFGNSSSCLNYIQTMFDEVSEEEKAIGDVPPIPMYLIIDFSLVTGIDASAVDVFSEIVSICSSNGCKLFVVGLKPTIKSALACGGFKPKKGDKYFRFISNLEAALGKAEDGLLTEVLRVEEKERTTSEIRNYVRMSSDGDDSGFRYSLEQIDQQHEFKFAPLLLGLEKYTSPVEIEAGQCVYQSKGGVVSDKDRGLFFIETGLLRVERDPSCSVSRCAGTSLRRRMKEGIAHHGFNETSIGKLNARSPSAAKISAILKGLSSSRINRQYQSFRLARIGPGFVVGGIELSTGLQNPGIQIAVTNCRLHHLPYNKMAEIEQREPILMLNLYKLLTHLIARREEKAVEQLTTMHSIMTSDPILKPLNRSTLGAIQRAMADG